MTFATAEQVYGPPKMYPGSRPAMWASLYYWHRRDILPFEPKEFIDGIPSLVVVDAGRWCALCPFCQGTQIPSTTDHWFFCNDCLNSEEDYRLVPLVWPNDPSPYTVMSVLALQNNIEQRNWVPGDSISIDPDIQLPRMSGAWSAPSGSLHDEQDIERFMKIARYPSCRS